MAGCTSAFVHVHEVQVSQSEVYGLFWEPGTSAEWRLTFKIGAETFGYADDNVKNGSVLPINRDFTVDLSSGSDLTIEVWGEELDDSSANDPIPRASLTLTPDQVRTGPAQRRLHGSDYYFHYDVLVTVRCADGGALDETSKSGPAVALFGGDVYLAWVGDPNLLVNVMNLRTLNKVVLNEHGVGGAALAALGNRLFIAWTGTDPDHHLNLMSSADGEHFENKVTLGHTSPYRPALASFKGQLYLAWTGSEGGGRLAPLHPGDGHLNILHSADGHNNFSINTKLDEMSFAGPSLSPLGVDQALWIGWVSQFDEGHLNFMASNDGESFGAKETLAETSKFAPSGVWYDDQRGTPIQFYVAWTGQDGGQKLNQIHALWAGIYEGKETLQDSSIAGPAMLARPGRIDVFWTGTDGAGHLSYALLVGG